MTTRVTLCLARIMSVVLSFGTISHGIITRGVNALEAVRDRGG